MAKSIGIGAEELARKAAASGKNNAAKVNNAAKAAASGKNNAAKVNDAAKAAASGNVKPQPQK
ncbi:MAG: hypothetical protein J6N15_00180 [Ruminiclostridium sp.]|nr:hypothetical protein [Ruminiclostridium sp.]